MRFEIRRSRRRRRQVYVKIVSDGNNKTLFHSENYNDIADARHAIALVIEQAADAPVVDLT